MSHDSALLGAQIAKTFVARRDVKAVQSRSGAWRPVTTDGSTDSERLPWKMGDFRSHVDGTATFGHYVVSKENTAKVFCFDIDLEEKIGQTDDGKPIRPSWSVIVPGSENVLDRRGDARSLWKPLDPWKWCEECGKGWYPNTQPARCEVGPGLKLHTHWIGVGANPDTLALTALLQETAWRLAERVRSLLDVPVAVSFSGSKGLHVYGLVGEEPSEDVRAAANYVIGSFERYTPSRGSNFFRDTTDGFDPISIEVFPKQDRLDGKDLGNLIRLPLGINRKSGLGGFFLQPGPYGYLKELDPMTAMTKGNPWL